MHTVSTMHFRKLVLLWLPGKVFDLQPNIRSYHKSNCLAYCIANRIANRKSNFYANCISDLPSNIGSNVFSNVDTNVLPDIRAKCGANVNSVLCANECTDRHPDNIPHRRPDDNRVHITADC